MINQESLWHCDNILSANTDNIDIPMLSAEWALVIYVFCLWTPLKLI